MQQEVIIHRGADRHRDLHDRDFGESTMVSLPVDDVVSILRFFGIVDPEPGRYTITISEPYA